MPRIPWVPLRLIQILLSRALRGRSIWQWHHEQMTTNDPYARIFVQGVVKALWQERADQAVVVLATTLADLARYIQGGKRPLE